MTRDLESRLSLCRTLPSLPAVAVRIIELAQDPDADLAEVARAVALDPALTTRLLRIANSPLYATTRRIENLRQAVTVLGLNATLSLALGFSLNRTMRESWGRRWDFQSVIRRSLLSATAARCLGDRIGLGRGEDLMLAGLVQDVGMLALAQIEPDLYEQLLADAVDNRSLVALERERLGTDHAQIGARLLLDWNLPPALAEAVRQSEAEQQDSEFNLCVALSGPLADIWINDDPAPAREHAEALLRQHLGIDEQGFGELTEQISATIPEISALFDMNLADPRRIDAILDHARELAAIRNLKGLEEATRERREAERLHVATRAMRERPDADPLLQLLTRAEFDKRLADEFGKSGLNGWPLTVAVIGDDDDAPNDEARLSRLRELAGLLVRTVRENDVLARYDRTRCCLLLPGTMDAAATSLCWRLLQGAQQLRASAGVDAATMSVGLATRDAAHHYPTREALLDAAEYAWQVASDAGGDRLERAGF